MLFYIYFKCLVLDAYNVNSVFQGLCFVLFLSVYAEYFEVFNTVYSNYFVVGTDNILCVVGSICVAGGESRCCSDLQDSQ